MSDSRFSSSSASSGSASSEKEIAKLKVEINTLEKEIMNAYQERETLKDMSAVEVMKYTSGKTYEQASYIMECESNLQDNLINIEKLKIPYYKMLTNRIVEQIKVNNPYHNNKIIILLNLLKNLNDENNKIESDQHVNLHKAMSLRTLIESLSSLNIEQDQEKFLSLLKNGCESIAVQSILINPNHKDMQKAGVIQLPEDILKEGVKNKYLEKTTEYLKESVSSLSKLYNIELSEIMSKQDKQPNLLNKLIATTCLLMLDKRNSDSYYETPDQNQKVKKMNSFIKQNEIIINQNSSPNEKFGQLITNLIIFMAGLEEIRNDKSLSIFKNKGKWGDLVYNEIIPIIMTACKKSDISGGELLEKKNFDKAIALQADINKLNKIEFKKPADISNLKDLKQDLTSLFQKCKFELPQVRSSMSSMPLVRSKTLSQSSSRQKSLSSFSAAASSTSATPSSASTAPSLSLNRTSSVFSMLAQAQRVSTSATANKYDLALDSTPPDSGFKPTLGNIQEDHAHIYASSALATRLDVETETDTLTSTAEGIKPR